MQINLLPWRKQARQIKKVQFTFLSIVFICAALVAIIILHIYFSMQLHHQNELNTLLQAEIDEEQSVLATFSDQQKDKNILEKQLHVIMDLYSKSFRAVRLLNEIPAILPGNINLEKIVREDNTITLTGSAPSDADVSAFKQILEKSPVFSSPIVKQISSDKDSKKANFEIDVMQEDEKK